MNRVLTPYSRHYNLIELGNRIKEEGAFWELLSVEGEFVLPPLGSWVRQSFFPKAPDGFFLGHHLVNCYINAGLNDEDRYVVITDDDMVELGFFEKLKDIPDDILIVSMQRSNKPSGGGAGCPFGTLIACPENMKCVHVGFEQLVIRGKILKNYRCEGVYHADGLLIEKIWAEHCEKFRFVPEAFVYFNVLPPGRGGRWDR